jgi:hypothetical protein
VLHNKQELPFLQNLYNFVQAQNGDSATFAELQLVIVRVCLSKCAFLDWQQAFVIPWSDPAFFSE